MNIPTEAVEAAAKFWFAKDVESGIMNEGDWGEEGGFYLDDAKALLDAVAPFLSVTADD